MVIPKFFHMQKAREKLQRYPSLIQAAQQSGTTEPIVQESVSAMCSPWLHFVPATDLLSGSFEKSCVIECVLQYLYGCVLRKLNMPAV